MYGTIKNAIISNFFLEKLFETKVILIIIKKTENIFFKWLPISIIKLHTETKVVFLKFVFPSLSIYIFFILKCYIITKFMLTSL